MAEHYPNHDPFEEVKFVTPFISPSPSLEHKQCPSNHLDIELDNGRDSTLPLQDISPKNKNYYAMDNLRAPTLELEKNNSTNKHEGFSFETSRVLCSLLESLELITLSATLLRGPQPSLSPHVQTF